ncbi:MBL fold metallo-hydrolase [Marinigracilibium pacificum]|uniref:MBL fold metallo-hydrolase n=1 Tax=Marinigracilibium pacificum TaxID=2729599 RepID=A0A848J1Q4_9BACT|nr:MBL fold metallo-hydrolase [Marinigracilibium pacificum]NMM50753.1 MBL fold metallo-hydrolase [Marinigracilibium pacificum]
MDISAKFSFFKVGQGAFYGGTIKKENQFYSIVYDCGTSSRKEFLNNEIDLFSDWLPEPRVIDLLFVSHFDFDHVSGLKRLFQKTNIKRIIIPYIKSETRKFNLLSYSEVGDYDEKSHLTDESDFDLEEYQNFLENPESFISNLNNETEIIQINGSENLNVEYSNYDNEEEGLYIRGSFFDEDQNIYNNDLQFFIGKIWEFTTYCQPVDESKIQFLKKDLLNLLGKENSPLTLEDLKSIIVNKRADTNKIYKTKFKDVNGHGLVLFHGPTPILSDGFSIDYQNGNLKGENNSCVATLLTGDISFNPNKNGIKFNSAFLLKLERVDIFQVPHHGSIHSWNNDEFNDLKKGKDWLSICNYGTTNSYKHPSESIKDQLKNHFIDNTEEKRFNYRIALSGIKWLLNKNIDE